MTRGQYIDSVHQMVNGGDINDSNEVWREDIAVLLPAAMNFALVGGMFDQGNQENDRDIPGTFIYPVLNIDLIIQPNLVYFTVPKNIVPLASDRGIRMITSPGGDHLYEKMNDNLYAQWHYYKNIMVGQRFHRVVGTQINLYNKPALETTANAYLIVSAEQYNDTDELPVPAGKEFVVIQQLFTLVMKQRAEAQQNIQFKSDINK